MKNVGKIVGILMPSLGGACLISGIAQKHVQATALEKCQASLPQWCGLTYNLLTNTQGITFHIIFKNTLIHTGCHVYTIDQI